MSNPEIKKILGEQFPFEQMDILRTIPTCELVEELRRRDGVEETIADPYQEAKVYVNGPAIVLTIID